MKLTPSRLQCSKANTDCSHFTAPGCQQCEYDGVKRHVLQHPGAVLRLLEGEAACGGAGRSAHSQGGAGGVSRDIQCGSHRPTCCICPGCPAAWPGPRAWRGGGGRPPPPAPASPPRWPRPARRRNTPARPQPRSTPLHIPLFNAHHTISNIKSVELFLTRGVDTRVPVRGLQGGGADLQQLPLPRPRPRQPGLVPLVLKLLRGSCG